jgi:hypothetical protein
MLYYLKILEGAKRLNSKMIDDNLTTNKNTEYHGKLYGKIGKKYFDTGKTSEYFDRLEQLDHIIPPQLLNPEIFTFTTEDGIEYTLKGEIISIKNKDE